MINSIKTRINDKCFFLHLFHTCASGDGESSIFLWFESKGLLRNIFDLNFDSEYWQNDRITLFIIRTFIIIRFVRFSFFFLAFIFGKYFVFVILMELKSSITCETIGYRSKMQFILPCSLPYNLKIKKQSFHFVVTDNSTFLLYFFLWIFHYERFMQLFHAFFASLSFTTAKNDQTGVSYSFMYTHTIIVYGFIVKHVDTCVCVGKFITKIFNPKTYTSKRMPFFCF